jgi:Fe-S-cluster containining protein
MSMMAVWCLDVHAGWRCRHSGACCSAGWTIPIEAAAYERVGVHFGSGSADHPYEGHLPEGTVAVLATRDDGRCVFLDDDPRHGRCEIHRVLGPDALPAACRQFPRVTLHDVRGTFVTVSHFCPTAASLLLEPARLEIVPAPAGFALGGDLEGLDARSALPPLLRPNLLTDPAGYDAWERRGIDALAASDSAGKALSLIERATLKLEDWRPGNGSLCDAVGHAFDNAKDQDDCETISSARDARRASMVLDSIPPGLERPTLPAITENAWRDALRCLEEYDRPARAWLASRLFGNWIAYSAPGLRVVATALRVYLAVLRVECVRQRMNARGGSPEQWFVEAIRQSDRLIVHLSDHRLLTPLVAKMA